MSYLQTMTEMLAGSTPQHERHIYEYHAMMLQMINELVPPMIEQYWKEHIEKFTVDVITLLNGKQTDLTGLRADLQELILEELNKCSITAKG